MGTAITAFNKALDTTFSNPLLIVVTVLSGFIGLFLAGVLSFIPILGGFIGQALLATFMAGVLGMTAYSTLPDTSAELSHYTETLSNRGPSVFGVTLIEQAAYFAITIVILFGFAFALGAGGAFTEQATEDPEAAANMFTAFGPAFFIGIAVYFLVVATVALFFQFLNVSVAVGDESVPSAFSDVYNLVTNNLVSVIGYSIARITYLIFVFVFIFGTVIISGMISETLAYGITLLLGLVIVPVAFTVFYAYHAHYYLEIADETIISDDTSTDSESSTETTNATDNIQGTINH